MMIICIADLKRFCLANNPTIFSVGFWCTANPAFLKTFVETKKNYHDTRN